MLLFNSGRGEALRRFLVEDGAGRDARFWKLAQALSALYPLQLRREALVWMVFLRGKKDLGYNCFLILERQKRVVTNVHRHKAFGVIK